MKAYANVLITCGDVWLCGRVFYEAENDVCMIKG